MARVYPVFGQMHQALGTQRTRAHLLMLLIWHNGHEMAIHDRDYAFRNSDGWNGGRTRISANTIIILMNIAVMVIQLMTHKPGTPNILERLGYFSTAKMFWAGGLEFWRVLTFQFLHADIVHLLMNMLGLYVFGSIVENHLGKQRYVALYLTCGIAGAMLYMLLNVGGSLAANFGMNSLPILIYNSGDTPLIGASAGVFGVVLASAYIAPNQVMQLIIPPVPVRIKVLAYVYVGIALANIIFGGRNAGGDAAHIGGAIAGAILIRNAYLLRDFFDIFTDSRKKGKGKRSFVEFGSDGRAGSQRARVQVDKAAARDQAAKAKKNAEIDRVLAKVSSKGLKSLTSSERRVLQDSTDSLKSNDNA